MGYRYGLKPFTRRTTDEASSRFKSGLGIDGFTAGVQAVAMNIAVLNRFNNLLSKPFIRVGWNSE